MKKFRATVYVQRPEGTLTRRILEEFARDVEQFKAQVRDLYALVDVDTEVWFGPITEKR